MEEEQGCAMAALSTELPAGEAMLSSGLRDVGKFICFLGFIPTSFQQLPGTGQPIGLGFKVDGEGRKQDKKWQQTLEPAS